ncbi:preprotein translocase subunit YajC [Leucobacter soli]|uniref:Preprotein translocase subunit YajC n=1 Tax=Leucobacter soli TaxID=2812850 RepID=A0A916JRF6_9MICO|nr:preprotein translocase subunit YajC [Leucobacter soli]CAG7596043.1 hypothetical protein LEUCIP111803_00069 [Leucobacter soli]
MDPMTLIMFGLIAVMIIFMIRNGKKRQQAAQEMQSKLQPGAEVMLQSGIFATVEQVDEAENRVTVRSGSSTLVVHRNAIGQIVTPVDAVETPGDEIAPDDDPAFGERIAAPDADTGAESAPDAADETPASDASEGDDTPKS